MNAKQLREALFYVENQGLTVAQLRQILFDIEDQDAELSFNFDSIAIGRKQKREAITADIIPPAIHYGR